VATVALAPSLFDHPGGEPSLDQLLVSAWQGLSGRRVVECPVCGAEMAPEYSAGSLPIGGRCRGCGSTLS
jgi:hypothetical protein